MTLRASIEARENGRLCLNFAVPVHGGHVIVSPCWGGKQWRYFRRCGQMAYVDTLEVAVKAAMIDGVHERVNEALTVPLTLHEAKTVAALLRWLLVG
jgi:hypothetical protein